MKHQIPKGLFDIVPYGSEDLWKISSNWQYIEAVLRSLGSDYGYKEIRTPIFEKTELFKRVGQTSDIVSKEMYTFEDRAKRSMSLRPEGTSSVMRAFIERGLSQTGKAHKFYYMGPMFRYERPQSGRYRQHHQFGVEAIGIASPYQDAEVIDMAWQLYHRLGIRNLSVQLNCIGSIKTREAFKASLKEHLKPHLNNLSEDSQTRFENNPLRILDSKDKKDLPYIEDAPSILAHLSKEEHSYFSQLCDLLKELRVPYTVNPRIVRGLDYYNGTVFEILAEDFSGSQNALGGGGRFDGLIHSLGGPQLPAIGFAVGLERVLQTMIQQKVEFPSESCPFVYLIPLDDKAKEFCFTLASKLRHKKIPIELDFATKKVQQALQRANSLNAEYTLVLGSDEFESKQVAIKHMKTRKEAIIPLANIATHIEDQWKGKHV